LYVDPLALGKFTITLPENIKVDFCNIIAGDPGCFHYNSSEATCVLTRNKDQTGTFGHCQLFTTGQSFTIENCGPDGHVWKEIDISTLRDVAFDEDIQQDIRPEHSTLLLDGAVDDVNTTAFSVKVYYTSAFDASTADINGFITQFIGETNQGFANSRIPIVVNLHGSELSPVNETENPFTILEDFTNSKDSFEELRGCADAAILLVTEMNSCGIAYFNSIQTGRTISVARKACVVGGFSFAHELAHHFGCHHNIERFNNTVNTYGHGHLIDQGTATTGFRTIMAQRQAGFLTRVNYFSNPDVILAATGTPTGITEISNNARVITENRMSMAAIGDETDTCLLPTTTTTPVDATTTLVTQDGQSPANLSLADNLACSNLNGLPTLRSLIQRGRHRVSCASDCSDLCMGRRHCEFWSYNLFSRDCYVWGFCYDFNRHNVGWRSGPKSCEDDPELQCHSTDSKFSLTYRCTKAEAIDECINECLTCDKCHFWAFQETHKRRRGSRCRLYSLDKNVRGWTSGLYQC
jgi:hypothetical protein